VAWFAHIGGFIGGMILITTIGTKSATADAPILRGDEGLAMKVTLYTRQGCHLCDDAKLAISAARRRRAFEYEELDIDTDLELRQLYNEEVPVIAIDGRKAFKYRVTADELLKKLETRA